MEEYGRKLRETTAEVLAAISKATVDLARGSDLPPGTTIQIEFEEVEREGGEFTQERLVEVEAAEVEPVARRPVAADKTFRPYDPDQVLLMPATCSFSFVAPGPLADAGWSSCSPRIERYSSGTLAGSSTAGQSSRCSGSVFGPLAGSSRSSCRRIPSRGPHRDDRHGVADLSARGLVRAWNECVSGNVCSRAISRTLSFRLREWKEPVAGPGCAWIVHEGRSLASLSRNDPYFVRQPNSGSPSPLRVWCK